MMKEEKTEKMPKAMVELQVDELSAEEIPTVQTEESSEDPSDSVTEILEPEAYVSENSDCQGSYVILTTEDRIQSEAIKEEAYEEISGRV